MSLNDSIADMLTRLRNSNQAYHKTVDIPFSKMKKTIIEIFKSKGFIKNFTIEGDTPSQKKIKVFLNYSSSKVRALQGLQKISRGGRRVYVGFKDIPLVQGGIGTAIISTSQGILTGEQARKLCAGGELICKVW